MGRRKSDEDDGTEVLEEDELTQAQAAELAECSVKTVQRAQRSGRLPPVLTRAAIKRFADHEVSEELQKADAVGAIVKSASDGVRDAYEQARLMVETSRRTFETGNVALQKELERAYGRIETLETKLEQGQAVIDELTKAQYNLKQAEAAAEVTKMRGKAAVEIGKKYIGPVVARIIGGEAATVAFQDFVDGLKDEQRDEIFDKMGAILTDEQRFQLAMILQSFETKKNATESANNGAPSSPESAPSSPQDAPPQAPTVTPAPGTDAKTGTGFALLDAARVTE